jgi:hypothetical protein
MMQKLSPSVLLLVGATAAVSVSLSEAKIADRSRVVKARYDSGQSDRFHDNGRPIEGQSYRSVKIQDGDTIDEVFIDVGESASAFTAQEKKQRRKEQMQKSQNSKASSTQSWKLPQMPTTDASTEYVERRNKGDVPMFIRSGAAEADGDGDDDNQELTDNGRRKLSSQLTGCCYNYQNYYAADLCALYGHDCESGQTPSHDSGDDGCEQDGLSFIGISFSVNTASGNPYSYQLCDQFPMENIIDRDYDYVMSMDEDGWLVGGGYKTFDYSGKMP